MRKLLLVLLVSTSAPAVAEGWSQWAVPTRIDIERAGGFMIYGDFGNAGACSDAGRIYVKAEHPQYKQIYATALAAFTGKYRISAYIQACDPVAWYSIPSYTYNVVDPAAVLNIAD